MKIGNDKILHAAYSFGICMILGSFIHPAFAFVATLLIGIGKEVYDAVSGKGTAEVGDLVADVVGASLAFGCLVFLYYLCHV